MRVKQPSPRKKCREVSPWRRFHPGAKTIQLIYAHLPPASILATGQHLLAQTQIEQRAHQLWQAGNGHPEDSLNDWLRAERETVEKLCLALAQKGGKETESAVS
jgi:hypothetical protein